MRSIPKTVAVLGVAGALLGAMAGTSLADPPSGTTPGHKDVVGVGSDTTQNVVGAIASDYDSSTRTRYLYSFDATGTTNVTTKQGCAAITRPNGSGAGIAALKAAARPKNDTVDYCVDYARSSRPPQTGDGPGLAFVRFAQDAITWSARSTSGKPTHAPAKLSITQLRAIYTCDASMLGGSDTGAVTWDEVGGTGTNKVVPVVPQSSSGTRSFFLAAIGITGTAPNQLGSCVQGTDNSVEENEGTNPIFSGANAQDIVFPYSIAVYLAQSQNGHGTGNQGNQKLEAVTSGTTTIKPTVGSAGALQLNPQLAVVGLTRFVYNVVRDSGTNQHVPTYLQPIFGNASASGYVCNNATSQADIKSYGFRTIGSDCGTVTVSTS